MDDFTQTLEVVSFTSNRVTKEVCGHLSGLKYPFTLSHASNCLAVESVPNSKNIFVFILGSSLPQQLSIYLAQNLIPCLAIFNTPISEWDQRIMQLSKNFCGWPCQEQELDLRLKHVLSQAMGNNAECSISLPEDHWVDLNLIGNSPVFIRVKSLVQKSAQCDAPVLIEGETGTGKEGAARAIHYLGTRRARPFIPVNCGALPDSLVENELFGHERGAYTDAKQQQPGLIAQAEGGTIFLDEIECLSLKGQASLLRFTENQVYHALGSKKAKQADVRIITASNTPLSDLTGHDRFRQDLFFRLNLITLTLPALRDRGKDIELLAEYFMIRFRDRYNQPDKYLDRKILGWMRQYDWPGNVRELENIIHRLFLLNELPMVAELRDCVEDCAEVERRKSPDRRQTMAYDLSFQAAKSKLIAHFEERYLAHLLAQTRGNVTMAAGLASMERRALGKLLKKHGIQKEKFKCH